MPSRWVSGTARSTSRETAVTVGRIMIARMTPATSMSRPTAGPVNRAPTTGSGPKVFFKNGSSPERITGARMKNPHSP